MPGTPDIPRPLLDDIESGKCLPFVGAGFSLNARLPKGRVMPAWPELTAHIASVGRIALASGPAVASEFEKRFGRVQLIEAIRKALHADVAEPGDAHKAFAELPFDTIYTTNFDLLLEDAFTVIKRPFRSLVGELQMPFHGGPLTTSIVKMHGDLRHEEHVVATADDYQKYLDAYPVIATHLSALLITRTAFFVGYSLSDPDFQHVRQVVRSRLGKFERMAYVLEFKDPDEPSIDRYADNLHMITLRPAPGQSRDSLLAAFFREIQLSIDAHQAGRFRAARPEAFEDVTPATLEVVSRSSDASPLLASSSNLCFVMMPFREDTDALYRNLIKPAVERHGLTALRADEMATLGSITEQIRVAIQQSRLCVADVSGRNPNVLYEVGIAHTLGKPTVLLTQDISDVPFDLRPIRHILYNLEALEAARLTLEKSIQFILGEDRLDEAERLINAGMYRAAVAILGILLEHSLRRLLERYANTIRTSRSQRPFGLGESLRLLAEASLVRPEDLGLLREAIFARNRAVHQLEEPSGDDARLVLRVVRDFVRKYVGEE
jgi:SIR2-like protein